MSGIIDSEVYNEKNFIRNTRSNVIIDWSREKEDYLLSLENQFRTLNENLNLFLKDLTDEKLL